MTPRVLEPKAKAKKPVRGLGQKVAKPKTRKPLPRSPLKASQKPVKRSAIKKKPRPAKDTDRIYGPPEFREYLHASPCMLCGIQGDMIQQAHIETGGMGRKSGWEKTGPLCGRRVRTILLGGGHVQMTPDSMYESCHKWYDTNKTTLRDKVVAAQAQFFARWRSFGGEER